MNTEKDASHQSLKDGLIVDSAQDKNLCRTSLQGNHGNHEESIQIGENWLSNEFNSFPYMFYKLCLVLTFVIALALQPNLILYQFKDLKDNVKFGLGTFSISSLLLSFGCGEMLLAMTKKRSTFAQKSLVKFQYSLVGTILGLAHFLSDSSQFSSFQIGMVALPVMILVVLFGGFAVLGAFKKNHPLARLQGSQDADFLEQNEAIASELLKYDKQLESWPYLIFRFWLKLMIVVEIFIISLEIIGGIQHFWRFSTMKGIVTPISMFFSSSFTAFCCYEMEVVLRTKVLKKSQKAIFRLKICFLVTTLAPIMIGIAEKYGSLLKFVPSIVVFNLVPVIILIGALFAKKIIEQRDRFANVSSYSGDHYL